MIKTCLIIFILIILFQECSSQPEISRFNNFEKTVQFVSYTLDSSVFELIDGYIKAINTNVYAVIEVYIEDKPDTVNLYLTFTQLKSDVNKLNIIGFLKIRERLVLFNSGISFLFKQDSIFARRLDVALDSVTLADDFNPPKISLYNNNTLLVRTSNNKIISTERIPRCPYGKINTGKKSGMKYRPPVNIDSIELYEEPIEH